MAKKENFRRNILMGLMKLMKYCLLYEARTRFKHVDFFKTKDMRSS